VNCAIKAKQTLQRTGKINKKYIETKICKETYSKDACKRRSYSQKYILLVLQRDPKRLQRKAAKKKKKKKKKQKSVEGY
jgi:hypothetical protein